MKDSSRLPVPPEVLREMLVPSAARSLLTLAVLLGATVGLGALARWLPAPAAFFVLILAGFFANGLVQLGHEAWHRNLFAAPWANDLFGHLFALLSFVPFRAARHAHMLHHRHNRTERDPDAYNVGSPGLRVKVQFYVVVVAGLLLAPLHFGVLYPAVFMRGRELRAHLVEMAAIVATWVAFLHWVVLPHAIGHALLVGWFLPYAFATPWNGLKSIADHHRNHWKGDRFHTATTVRTHPLVTLAWSGLNHHLDHHLYPRVPGPALPRLHELLGEELVRREAPVFDGYAKIFWEAFRAGPTYVAEGQTFLVDARAKGRTLRSSSEVGR